VGTVIVSNSQEAARVLGVHGGDGTLLWKRLATGSHLYADWDGFEWVALEAGAQVGMHLHAHTEEVFFFLAGQGEVTLDGVTSPVGPGDAVLTPLGSAHSVVNTGPERLDYLVVEVFPPEISGALPPRRPAEPQEAG
jgi:mannose-6-phosphate isomerase-like protein (cupin superfamily)